MFPDVEIAPNGSGHIGYITDPVPGQGWYDDNNGEIGDICAWKTRTLGGYTIQQEWSNKAGACV